MTARVLSAQVVQGARVLTELEAEMIHAQVRQVCAWRDQDFEEALSEEERILERLVADRTGGLR